MQAFLLTVMYALLLFILLFVVQLLTSALAGVSLFSLTIWMSELISLNAQIPELEVLLALVDKLSRCLLWETSSPQTNQCPLQCNA